jgi:hypothetical protein
MRVPPMMNVEVDGQIVRRPGELHVLQRDADGQPVVSHMRPQLLAGEILCERAGQIPTVIREGT